MTRIKIENPKLSLAKLLEFYNWTLEQHDSFLDAELLLDLVGIRRSQLFFIYVDMELQGYCFITGDRIKTIELLFIAKAKRQLGLAKKLLKHIFNYWSTSKFELCVSTTNDPAFELYRSLGFKKTTMYRNYYGVNEFSRHAFYMIREN